MESTLSVRGKRAATPSLSYLGQFLQAQQDLHSEENPEGFVVCAVAENKQVCHRLAARMEAEAAVDTAAMSYNDMRGIARMREAFCRMMEATALAKDGAPAAGLLDPTNLSVSSGSGALVEIVTWCTTGPGEGVIIPSPYYPAFDNDCAVRAGCKLFEARTDSALYSITVEALDEAAARAEASGAPPKLLILTNPSNPLGIAFSKAEIVRAVRWAVSKKMHVMVDEIYANSVFDPYAADHEFVSAVHLCAAAGIPALSREALGMPPPAADEAGAPKAELLGPLVHVIWGMSKDFGASGLRVGALYSENQAIAEALGNLGYFSTMGNTLQGRVAAVLEDVEWCKAYLAASHESLKRSYDTLWRALGAAGIPSTPASAGLFAWVDLRELLDEPTAEAEAALQKRLFEECRLLLTPGLSCHAAEPGYFRCCFAWMPPASLEAGIRRLGEFTARRRAAAGGAAASGTSHGAAAASPPAASGTIRVESDSDDDEHPAGIASPGSLDAALAEADRTLARNKLRRESQSSMGSPTARRPTA